MKIINEKNLTTYIISRDHIDKEGYLLMRGEVSKSFQRRWFILKGNLLFYFDKKGDKDSLGLIILEGCTTELTESEEYYVFKLIFHGAQAKAYEFGAESQGELEIWMKYLSRSSYDYLKLMVAELQQQLEEIEELENSTNTQQILSPLMYSPLPSSNVFHKVRENPFNQNDEISYCDLSKCGESLYNASQLLSRSSSCSHPGPLKVNPSLPPCIPFRPAPSPSVSSGGSSLRRTSAHKPFTILHRDYGIPILEDRKKYTAIIFNSICEDVKTETLIQL